MIQNTFLQLITFTFLCDRPLRHDDNTTFMRTGTWKEGGIWRNEILVEGSGTRLYEDGKIADGQWTNVTQCTERAILRLFTKKYSKMYIYQGTMHQNWMQTAFQKTCITDLHKVIHNGLNLSHSNDLKIGHYRPLEIQKSN